MPKEAIMPETIEANELQLKDIFADNYLFEIPANNTTMVVLSAPVCLDNRAG